MPSKDNADPRMGVASLENAGTAMVPSTRGAAGPDMPRGLSHATSEAFSRMAPTSRERLAQERGIEHRPFVSVTPPLIALIHFFRSRPMQRRPSWVSINKKGRAGTRSAGFAIRSPRGMGGHREEPRGSTHLRGFNMHRASRSASSPNGYADQLIARCDF